MPERTRQGTPLAALPLNNLSIVERKGEWSGAARPVPRCPSFFLPVIRTMRCWVVLAGSCQGRPVGAQSLALTGAGEHAR